MSLTAKQALLIVAAILTALILFFPLVSRSVCTFYADHLAEKLLNTSVELSGAELHPLRRSLIIYKFKASHPLRPKETFLAADQIELKVNFIGMLWGESPTLQVSIDEPSLLYATDRRGRWELQNKIPLFQRNPAKKKSKEEKRLPINVAEIILEDGAIEFRDGRVGKTTHLSDIDLTVTDVQLPTEGDPLPAEFTLTFEIDDRADFKLTGQADFLSPKTSFEANLQLKGLSIPPFSPYYDRSSIPVKIVRGTLSLTGQGKCKDNRLRLPIHMVINNLEISPKRQSIFGFTSNQVTAGLQDRDNQLELDAVIVGNIHSPNFHLTTDLGQVFAKQLSQELVKGLTNPLQTIEEKTKSGLEKLKRLFQ